MKIDGMGAFEDMTRYGTRLKLIFILISAVLYLISLFQTAFYVSYEQQDVPALARLVWGIFYLTDWLAWLGNVTLVVAYVLLLFRRQTAGLIASGITLLLMLSFLLEKTALVNESGHYAPVLGYGPGYLLWISSASVILACNNLFLNEKRNLITTG